LGGLRFGASLDQGGVSQRSRKRGAKADAIMIDNDTRPERVVVRMR
jgi:hypothetical protein